jgi:hypothetical protein
MQLAPRSAAFATAMGPKTMMCRAHNSAKLSLKRRLALALTPQQRLSHLAVTMQQLQVRHCVVLLTPEGKDSIHCQEHA